MQNKYYKSYCLNRRNIIISPTLLTLLMIFSLFFFISCSNEEEIQKLNQYFTETGEAIHTYYETNTDMEAVNLNPVKNAIIEATGLWEEEEAAIYEAEGLYELINGQAESYHSYGVRRALAFIPVFDNSENVYLLEVYDMGHPVNAFGIFHFEYPKEGEKMDFANEALLSYNMINAWKDRFYFKLTSYSGLDAVKLKDYLVQIIKVTLTVADIEENETHWMERYPFRVYTLLNYDDNRDTAKWIYVASNFLSLSFFPPVFSYQIEGYEKMFFLSPVQDEMDIVADLQNWIYRDYTITKADIPYDTDYATDRIAVNLANQFELIVVKVGKVLVGLYSKNAIQYFEDIMSDFTEPILDQN